MCSFKKIYIHDHLKLWRSNLNGVYSVCGLIIQANDAIKSCNEKFVAVPSMEFKFKEKNHLNIDDIEEEKIKNAVGKSSKE